LQQHEFKALNTTIKTKLYCRKIAVALFNSDLTLSIAAMLSEQELTELARQIAAQEAATFWPYWLVLLALSFVVAGLLAGSQRALSRR
jgi:ABC-type amino acid transport system permease subunit